MLKELANTKKALKIDRFSSLTKIHDVISCPEEKLLLYVFEFAVTDLSNMITKMKMFDQDLNSVNKS